MTGVMSLLAKILARILGQSTYIKGTRFIVAPETGFLVFF